MVSRLLLALLLGAVLSSPAEAQTSATVDFDNPRPPGASGDLLNGVFQGIDRQLNVDPLLFLFF